MAEYIDREAAKKMLCEKCIWKGSEMCVKCNHPLDEVPSVDLTSERHGHWERDNDRPRSWVYRCSECGKKVYYPIPKRNSRCEYTLCPWCVARMEAT